MTAYAQLETKEAVRAALERGKPVEILLLTSGWAPIALPSTDEEIAEALTLGYKFRAPLPAVPASDAEGDWVRVRRSVMDDYVQRGMLDANVATWLRESSGFGPEIDAVVAGPTFKNYLDATPAAPPSPAETREAVAPAAWIRAHRTHTDIGMEYDEEIVGGQDEPAGEGWTPLYPRQAVDDSAEQFEKYVSSLIAKAPNAKKLGERLAELLDDDQFKNVEPQLLALARMEATPPATPDLLARIGELADEMASAHSVTMGEYARRIRALIDGAQK